MEKYIIALKEIGIRNEIILSIIDNFSDDDYDILFKGNYLDLQYKYNIDLSSFSKLLSDTDLLSTSIKKAKTIIKGSNENKIKIAIYNTKRYPANLRRINNPPAIIYYKGRGFYKKHKKSIGCVGTRSMSDFGSSAINSIVPKLVSEKFTIISGLAEGVDALCHQECLDNHGTTIAVLAHGLDMIYPKSNIDLANNILDNNGLLVSEYPIGTPPDRFRFVNRNRIISGLSKGVVVFETKEKSGTMHTVKFAVKEDIPVFCPMPNEITPTTAGLAKILNDYNGIPIQYRSSYETVVFGTGYRLKDRKRLGVVKSKAASDIICATNILSSQILGFDTGEELSTVSVTVDKELYLLYKEVLKINHLSNKDLINAFMLSVVTSRK